MNNTTDRRTITSPINGAKSHGPTTEDGKKRAAANSLQHGLYARDIVLITEKQPEYDALKADFLATYTPATNEEHELVIDMVNARWRIRRVERHENALLDLEIARAIHAADAFDPVDHNGLEAKAIEKLAQSRALDTLNRMAQRLERSYHRSREALLKMQRGRAKAAQPPPLAEPEPAPVSNEPSPVAPKRRSWPRWFPFVAQIVLTVLFLQPTSLLKPITAALNQPPAGRRA